jgi:RecJ-like exonuclease
MKKISLIISLLGILVLFMIINSSPKIFEISSINNDLLNKPIKIQGTISKVNIYENNFTSFTISDKTGKIQGICNCPNIKENQTVQIKGKITSYQNQLQITVDQIIS